MILGISIGLSWGSNSNKEVEAKVAIKIFLVDELEGFLLPETEVYIGPIGYI